MDLCSLDVSCEPMDIDLSSNSIKNIDISNGEDDEPRIVSRPTSPCEYKTFLTNFIKQEPVENISSISSITPCESETKPFQSVKKYHIIMQPKRQEGSSIWIQLSVILILCISALVYHVNTLTCCKELDIKQLKDTLSRKLYGQERAIDLLAKSLDVPVSSKILFVYGGTGVGKTYATTLMFEGVWSLTNVYHYLMPTFMEAFPNNLLLGMTFCKSSILIVDDLSQNDFQIKENIANMIEKSESLKKNITVVLIFNSDIIEKGFMKYSNAALFEFELREAFSTIEVYKEYIKFEPLKEEHLKLCIKNELGYPNVANMDHILKNFNVTLDGCKGVYAKMKLLNIV